MQIIADNQLHIIGATLDQRKAIKSKLTLANPAYWKLKAMKKWVGNTPEYFEYFTENSSELTIPRGLLTRTERYLGVKADMAGLKTSCLGLELPRIELRDYQTGILSDWDTKRPTEGVFCLSTGSGKTIVALEVIKRLGLTATILVPNNVLLSQFVEEAKKHWDYEVGIVNGDKKEIKPVTVACVASLFNNKDLLAKLVENTSVLIVDECAGFVSDERAKVIEQFKPSYVYGLTATPEREDGQTAAIHFYFGDIIEEYEHTQIEPTIEVVDTKTFIPVRCQYNEMVDDMITNDSRNTLLAGLIIGEALQGRKILVLTKRIEHYKNIRAKLPDGPSIICADSSDNEIHAKLNDLRENKMDFTIILGTFSLLGTGFNIEKLDTLVIAGDLRSSVLTHQSSGRVLRLLKDKTAKIIDLWDRQNAIFSKQFNERKKFYDRKKWVVKMPWN